MDANLARRIVLNAVETTRPRWEQYARSWQDIDTIFLRHGYEQQGFRFFRLVPFLEEAGVFSIDALGSILDETHATASYDPAYAKGLDSDFYAQLQRGSFGPTGVLFEQAVRALKVKEPASCGRFYWKLLWYMLQACAYLRRHHKSSFARYVISQYAHAAGLGSVPERVFLGTTEDAWQRFLQGVRPWKHLRGIGPNVFDFIFGDIVEADFAKNSFKFDSANQHFLTVTGIASLIVPFQREPTMWFMQALDLPYTLREVNKGIYTYCSMTEAENYGFCRRLAKCSSCAVMDICERNLAGAET